MGCRPGNRLPHPAQGAGGCAIQVCGRPRCCSCDKIVHMTTKLTMHILECIPMVKQLITVIPEATGDLKTQEKSTWLRGNLHTASRRSRSANWPGKARGQSLAWRSECSCPECVPSGTVHWETGQYFDISWVSGAKFGAGLHQGWSFDNLPILQFATPVGSRWGAQVTRGWSRHHLNSSPSLNYWITLENLHWWHWVKVIPCVCCHWLMSGRKQQSLALSYDYKHFQMQSTLSELTRLVGLRDGVNRKKQGPRAAGLQMLK